jgi:hypothetical protein
LTKNEGDGSLQKSVRQAPTLQETVFELAAEVRSRAEQPVAAAVLGELGLPSSVWEGTKAMIDIAA